MKMEIEIENWKETARQYQRNVDYYRGLVVKVGEMLGADVYLCDDGSASKDVLCEKVPECLRKTLALYRKELG